jgi:hypothetical protein
VTGGPTAVQAVDWSLLSPLLGPALAIVAVLLVDAIGPERVALRRAHDVLALLGVAGSGGAVLWLAARGGVASTMCAPASGLNPASCSFTVSAVTLTFQGLVVAGAAVCLLLALDGTGATDRAPHHVLMLTAVAGALALAGSRDLVTLVVAFETASLPAIGLVALRRDPAAAQGALTLLLTAIGSLALLLMGIALLLFPDRAAPRPGLDGPVRSRFASLGAHGRGARRGAGVRRGGVQAVGGAVPPVDAGHLRGCAAADRSLLVGGVQGGRVGGTRRPAAAGPLMLADAWA